MGERGASSEAVTGEVVFVFWTAQSTGAVGRQPLVPLSLFALFVCFLSNWISHKGGSENYFQVHHCIFYRSFNFRTWLLLSIRQGVCMREREFYEIRRRMTFPLKPTSNLIKCCIFKRAKIGFWWLVGFISRYLPKQASLKWGDILVCHISQGFVSPNPETQIHSTRHTNTIKETNRGREARLSVTAHSRVLSVSGSSNLGDLSTGKGQRVPIAKPHPVATAPSPAKFVDMAHGVCGAKTMQITKLAKDFGEGWGKCFVWRSPLNPWMWGTQRCWNSTGGFQFNNLGPS